MFRHCIAFITLTTPCFRLRVPLYGEKNAGDAFGKYFQERLLDQGWTQVSVAEGWNYFLGEVERHHKARLGAIVSYLLAESVYACAIFLGWRLCLARVRGGYLVGSGFK